MATALIIGAGSNVGQATTDAFVQAGYKVATASRSSKSGSNFKHFIFDASKPEIVSNLFSEVRKAVGIPSVIVYNAYSDHISKRETPFQSSIDVFQHDMNVNATSVWVAAGEAVKCFEDLGAEGLGTAGGTFIFTGNLLNVTAAPGFLTFGMGKSAAAHLIQHLALVAYPGKPYKFYYGDQRHADGSPMPTGLSGPAHATLYLQLAKDPEQKPWQQTFVNDVGYVAFPREEAWAGL